MTEHSKNMEGIWPELENLPDELQSLASKIIKAAAEHNPAGNTGTPPEIINHHTEKGKKRWRELLEKCEKGEATFDPDPYIAAHEELTELAEAMSKIPDTEEGIIDHFIQAIPNKKTKIILKEIVSFIYRNPKLKSLLSVTRELLARKNMVSVKEIRDVLNHGSLVQDLLQLKNQAMTLGSDPEEIEKDSSYIWFPEDKTLIKMIGKEAYHLLLAKGRALGLIPFEALDKLRTLKIRCAGASAVVHLIDLLICLGAENVEWWDSGLAALTNIGRLNRTGDIKFLRKSKATKLQDKMHEINPNGAFTGTHGKVVFPTDEEMERGDVDYETFMGDADLVIEVIDNSAGKIGLRLFIKENHGNVKVVYLADVSNGFVGIEDTTQGNLFHQNLDEKVFTDILREFQEIAVSIDPENPDDEKQKKLQAIMLNLKAVVLALLKDFPLEHQLQFLTIITDLFPFWSQTAISARETSAIGTRLVLKLMMVVDEGSVTGKNYTSKTIPHSLTPNYSRKQQKTIRKLMSGAFGFPIEYYDN